MGTVSIIMPALNEERCLRRAVEDVFTALRRLNVEGEIIVVNDGSSDRTGEVADELARRYPSLKVIHHAKPHGIGSSFWEGARQARNDVVTLLPGDGENEPYEILRYLGLLDHVDIVIPFVYNREIRTVTRRIISKAYKAIINLSFGLLLNYMNGTVLYRRSVLLSLNLESRGFFYQTELLIKSIRRGYLYAEVPYALQERPTGKSKALTFKSLFKLSSDYLRTIQAVFFGGRGATALVADSVTTQRRELLA